MDKRSKGAGNQKLRAASFSLVVNVFLIVIKVAVWLLTGSIALLAELLHSFFDMLASVFAYIGIKKAGEPDDSDHLYGHEKYENLSSLAQTVLIVATSLFVIYEAVNRMISGSHEIESTELGMGVMVLTIVVDYFTSKYLHRTSEEHSSAALEADAYHFTTDLWSALAVLVGLFFVAAGFPVFDSLAAIFVAILMLFVSYKLGRKAVGVLMDSRPHDGVMQEINQAISSVPQVESFHKLRVRQAGSKIFIDVHLQVAPKMSVEEGHYVAHEVKERLVKSMENVKEVTVHVEPNVQSYRRRIR